MIERPIRTDIGVQLVVVPDGASARDQALAAEENTRRIVVQSRREYAQGEQYDRMNAEHLAATCEPGAERLPEHERIHAYSVQIEDSIEFLTSQLAEAFSMLAEDAAVQDVIEAALRASEQFSGDNEDDEIVVDLVLRDAMVAMDVPCHIKWDPIEATAYVECWPSEEVEFDFAARGLLERVIRTQYIWVYDPLTAEDREVAERVVYEMVGNEFGQSECQATTYWDTDPEPHEMERLGLPFIPWALIKVKRKKLRGTRGESLITGQVMQSADRYNANEQNSYLISRYNSHANLAVVGDLANLEIKAGNSVAKDVADVLAFPGGTAVQAISLPTDAQMIEHQRGVLAEAIYNLFGLTRVEPDTIEGLGSVSGYALEILNRKTEGTFRGIRREFTSSFKGLLSMILDVQAYRSVSKTVAFVNGEEVEVQVDDENELVIDDTLLGPDGVLVLSGAFWEVDPDAVYPNRVVEITMGSGYIVSDVLVRDDYTAGLISRREALGQRGYEPDDIDRIEEEIDDEKGSSAPPAGGEGGLFGAAAATAAAAANGQAPADTLDTPPAGTAAGSTVGA